MAAPKKKIKLNQSADTVGNAVASIRTGIQDSVKARIIKSRPEILIPTPSTVLNLRCSGFRHGAFAKGTMANLIGDSHAGKSILALGMLAECSIDSRFDDYELIYNDTENATAFDIEEMFGARLFNRIDIISTKLHEHFEADIKKRLDAGKKIIYVVDSFDGMTTEAAEELRKENIKRLEKGLDKKDSYGDGKAKLFSQFGGTLQEGLTATNSFCLIVSQTRQNIGFGAMFNPKTRSGGDALRFYSFHEIWLASMVQEKHSKYKKEIIRVDTEARITKNKLIGRKGVAEFSILHGYGIDNIRSCIKMLLDLGYWTGSADKIDTKGFYPEKPVARIKLIDAIESKNKEQALAVECQKAYEKLMAEIKPNRKKRY